MIFQTSSIAIKSRKLSCQNGIYAKQMFFVFIPIIDIRGTSVFECPGDFLDFMPKQEDLNIMNMSSER